MTEGALLPGQPDRIETQRLILRRYLPTDAQPLVDAFSEPEMSWNLGRVPHPYTMEHARAFLSTQGSPLEDGHAITLEDGTLIGACALKWRAPLADPLAERMPETATIGYWVGREHWGHGYASEAVAAKLAEHFARGGDTVTAVVFSDNPASLRVLEHVGFRRVGSSRDRNLVRPQATDVSICSCTASDFAGASWNLALETDGAAT